MNRPDDHQCALLVYPHGEQPRRCSRRATSGPYCWQHDGGPDGPTVSEQLEQLERQGS